MRRTPINSHPTVAEILLRVSTPGQQEGYSLDTQEAGCRSFCEQRGLTVHAVHKDVFSGEYAERPGFQAVVRDLQAGKVGVVVVFDVDRAGRDTYVGATLLHEANQAGARLSIVQMPDLDLGTPMGEAMFFMRLTQAQQEIQSIRERTTRGKRGRVASGKPLVPPITMYGYRWVHEPVLLYGKTKHVATRLEPDPATAPIVRRIYEEAAAGVTNKEIARRLNADGIPTRSQAVLQANSRHTRATEWCQSAASAILRNRIYSGEEAPTAYRRISIVETRTDPVTGERRTVRTQRRRTADDELPPVPLPEGTWPPLVSADLATRAHVNAERNKQWASRRNATPDEWLLRGGFIICGECGRPMDTRHMTYNGKHPAGYKCNDRQGKPACGVSIQAQIIDPVVWKLVKLLADEPEVAEQAFAHWRATSEWRRRVLDERLESAERRVQGLTQEYENWMAAVGNTRDAAIQADVLLRAQRSHETLAKAQAHRDDVRDQLHHDPHLQQLADIQEWAAEWRTSIHAFDYEARRRTLHRLGLRVVMFRGTPNKRRYLIVLGWPEGVRTAEPHSARPVGVFSDMNRIFTRDYPEGIPDVVQRWGSEEAMEQARIIEAADTEHHDVTQEELEAAEAALGALSLKPLGEALAGGEAAAIVSGTTGGAAPAARKLQRERAADRAGGSSRG
jgi:site-specific DNA recombinase